MDFLLDIAELDGRTIGVLAFGVALAGLLFGVADSWRRILRHAPLLPLWRMLEGAGISRRQLENRAGPRAVRNAEVRCMLCARRSACRAEVALGGLPSEDCANWRLVDQLRLASRQARSPAAQPLHLT